MVEIGRGATAFRVDTLGVIHEGVGGGVDGYGNRTHGGNGLKKFFVVAFGDVNVANVRGTNCLLAVSAFAVDSLVGVGVLRVNPLVVFHILKCLKKIRFLINKRLKSLK